MKSDEYLTISLFPSNDVDPITMRPKKKKWNEKLLTNKLIFFSFFPPTKSFFDWWYRMARKRKKKSKKIAIKASDRHWLYIMLPFTICKAHNGEDAKKNRNFSNNHINWWHCAYLIVSWCNWRIIFFSLLFPLIPFRPCHREAFLCWVYLQCCGFAINEIPFSTIWKSILIFYFALITFDF